MGTLAAQALSAIFRTGMRFGVSHLTDVLRGKASDKIRQYAHDQLPTYGVGNDLDEHAWKQRFPPVGRRRSGACRHGRAWRPATH